MIDLTPTPLTFRVVKGSKLSIAEGDSNTQAIAAIAAAAMQSLEVQALIVQNPSLNAQLPAIQQLVTNSLAAYDLLATQLGRMQGRLDPFKTGPYVDGQTVIADGQTAFAYLAALARSGGSASPSAPVKNVAPHVDFPASHAVTITNASPAVFTWTAHGKLAGDWFTLETTGAFPAGLPAAGTPLYVLATGLTTNTLQAALTPGGAAVITTSAGSGVHTGWSSASVNAAGIYHAGTYTTTGTVAVTSRDLQIVGPGGALLGSITGIIDGATLPPLPAAAGLTTRQVSYVELANWNASQPPVTNPSIVYTVNVPAAVPTNNTLPTLTGSANPGSLLAGGAGSWAGSPTGYNKIYRRNPVFVAGVPQPGTGTIAASLSDATTTLGYTVLPTDAGATITFSTIASNANGPSVEKFSPTVLVITGAIAPSWTDPNAVPPIELPGWAPGPRQVGIALVANFGAAANNPNPNGYSYQVYSNGAPATGPNAAGTNVSGFQYVPQPQDQDHDLSFSLTATNGAPTGATWFTSGETIGPAVSGGGGTATLIGVTYVGVNTAASADIAPLAGLAPLDFLLLVESNNGPVAWNAVTGATFVQDDIAQFLSTNGEEVATLSRIAGSSEPANYTINPTVSEIMGAVLLCYRGPTTIVDHATNKNDAANSNPCVPTFNSVTPTAAGQVILLIAVLDCVAACVATWTDPVSGITFTKKAQQDFVGSGTGAAGQWASIAVWEGRSTGNTPTGALTASAALSAGNANWITYTKVLG